MSLWEAFLDVTGWPRAAGPLPPGRQRPGAQPAAGRLGASRLALADSRLTRWDEQSTRAARPRLEALGITKQGVLQPVTTLRQLRAAKPQGTKRALVCRILLAAAPPAGLLDAAASETVVEATRLALEQACGRWTSALLDYLDYKR